MPTPNTAPSWRERDRLNRAGQCYHGVCITQPCAACEAEGYTKCPRCLTLFVPDGANKKYCTDACRHAAAYQRERERQQAREMAREGV